MTRSPVRFALPIALFAVLGALVIVPLVMIAYASLATSAPFSGDAHTAWTFGNYAQLFSPEIGFAALNTLVVAVGGTCIALVIGCSLAWLVARSDIPGKAFVQLAAIMPLFLSVLVASAAWSTLASGRTGYINLALAGLGIPWLVNVESRTGIALVFGLYYAPYVFLLVQGALALVHPDMEEAAAVSGASLWRILRRVTFPLIKPAVLGATLLVFALMVEDFPVPQLLGAPVGIETLSVAIYNLMTHVPAQPNAASALSVLLMIITASFVFLQRRALGSTDYRTVTGKGMQARVVRLGSLRWLAFVFVVVYVLLAIAAPMFALIEGAFRSNIYIPSFGALFASSGLSVQPFLDALSSPDVASGALNSVLAGLGAAIGGGALSFIIAYVVNRTRLPGRTALEYVAMLPVAIPALVLGIGILWTWVAAPVPVYGTLAILSIGYVSRFLPQGYRAISSSIAQIHDDLESAAQVAGARRPVVIRRITLPLVRGSVVSSVFILLVLSIRELTASLFLYTTGTRTLAIVIYEKYITGSWSSVAAISLLFTVALAVLTVAGRRWLQARV
jgi:iron(III) transport system permease protein